LKEVGHALIAIPSAIIRESPTPSPSSTSD